MREDKGSGRRTGLGSGDPGPDTTDSQLSPHTYSDLSPFQYNEELDQKVFECSASKALLHMPPLQPRRQETGWQEQSSRSAACCGSLPQTRCLGLAEMVLWSQHAWNHEGEDECSELCFSCSSHPIPPAVFQQDLIETFTHSLLKADFKQDWV